jgi:hypothetical protein
LIPPCSRKLLRTTGCSYKTKRSILVHHPYLQPDGKLFTWYSFVLSLRSLSGVAELLCRSSPDLDARDIEDLVELGKSLHGLLSSSLSVVVGVIAVVTSLTQCAACPFFAARVISETADIVFCPYNYIIDPGE